MSWASLIHCAPLHPFHLRRILILSSCICSSEVTNQNPVLITRLLCMLHSHVSGKDTVSYSEMLKPIYQTPRCHCRRLLSWFFSFVKILFLLLLILVTLFFSLCFFAFLPFPHRILLHLCILLQFYLPPPPSTAYTLYSCCRYWV